MRITRLIQLSMLSALGASWLAGCVTQPGDDQIDEGNADHPPQTAMRALTAVEDPALAANALDGRAAAAAQAQIQALSGGGTAPMGLTASWYSGIIHSGQEQHWTWNNASLTAAYQVGLSPEGADYFDCRLEIVRTWDVQQYGGERELHFVIKNVGTYLDCNANILLTSRQRSSTWSTGALAAGASRTWTWNNANPLEAAHFVGVSPTGSTTASPCQLEVTHAWYAQQPGGERELRLTVTNIGAITCQGDIQLALTTNVIRSWELLQIEPGVSTYQEWRSDPQTGVFVVGLSPQGAAGTTPCHFEVVSRGYEQSEWLFPVPERHFFFYVKNIGSTTCSVQILLNHLD
jgi:hypothetical protein